MSSQIDTQNETSFEKIPDLSIRDMISLATRQLSGSSRKTENGFCIDMRDYSRNQLIRVELAPASVENLGTNLRISATSLRDDRTISMVNLLNIEHLYVTWETKGMISFCFAGDGRYKLINVTTNNGVAVVEDIDRRREPPKDAKSESARRARTQRRIFYHIGLQFDKASPHDPMRPLRGSVDDEDTMV